MPTLQMIYEILGVDKASPAFARAGGSAEAAGKKVDGLIKAVAGFAAADLGYHIIKLAGDFQQSTNVLVTAAGESQKNLKLIRDGILDIAVKTGTAWKQVSDATYTAEKAGYRGADALKVVKAAAEGAREENANLATVTDAVTSVLASYHLKASDAVKVTDEIKTAAGESKTTMELFAGSLSTVLPLASAAKISFADVAGVLATLTQHGTTADEATQEIAFTIRNLTASGGVAQKTMSQLGISVNDVTTKLGDGPGGRGLAGTLNYLAETVLKHAGPAGTVLLGTFNQSQLAAKDAQTEFNNLSPAVQKLAKQFEDGQISAFAFRKELRTVGGEQSVLGSEFLTTYANAKSFTQQLRTGINNSPTILAELKNILGGANGLNVLLQTTGDNAAGVAQRTKAVADSAKDAGKDVSGWKITQDNLNTQLESFHQSLDVIAITIGTAVLKPLTDLLKVLVQHPAVLKAVAIAVGALAAAWALFKIGSIIGNVVTLTAKLFGLAAATTAVGTAAEGAATKGGFADLIASADRLAYGLGDAEKGTGVAGAAKGAATEIGGVGAAISGAGLLAGGAAVIGIAGIAAGIHSIITDGQVKNLPALDALDNAITSGGLGGKPGAAVVTAALQSTGTGNNRGENILTYAQRVLGNQDALQKVLQQHPGFSASEFTVQNLIKTIQTGGKGALEGFLGVFNDLEWALKGSPATIDKVDTYLRALWSRYNSARVEAQKLTDQQKKLTEQNYSAAVAANALSTNANALAKAYGIGSVAANNLAHENAIFTGDIKSTIEQLHGYGDSLNKNTEWGRQAIGVVGGQIEATKQHAQAVLYLTGNENDAALAFKAGITQFEQNAIAAGVNKQDLDALINSLIGVKNNEKIDIIVTAQGVFNWADPQQQAAYFNATSPNSPAATFYAAGGIENHTAHIANRLRIFGEPETGGEAYIPLSPSKRGRSLQIWAQTGKHLGVFADGGIISKIAASIPPYAGSDVVDLSQHMASVWKSFAAQEMTKLIGPVGSGSSRWAPLVLQVLGMLGLSSSWLPNVLRQISTESGGNAQAINNWDSNAAIGQNSRGLLQVIPATFAAYAGPYAGLGIYNPLANVYAGLNYAVHRYGSLGILGQGHGYDAGGILPPGVTTAINASGKPEAILTNAQWQAIAALSKADVAKYLQALAIATNTLIGKLNTFVTSEKQYRDTLLTTLTNGNTFSDVLGQSGTAGDVKTLLSGKLSQLKGFVSKIAALRKGGWPGGLIRDVANAGVDQGSQFADVLLGASKADKASIIGLENSLTASQLNAANLTTLLSSSNGGLTKMPAINALQGAILNPLGPVVGTLIKQAATAQTSPLVHVENMNSTVDMQLVAREALFLQQAGAF